MWQNDLRRRRDLHRPCHSRRRYGYPSEMRHCGYNFWRWGGGPKRLRRIFVSRVSVNVSTAFGLDELVSHRRERVGRAAPPGSKTHPQPRRHKNGGCRSWRARLPRPTPQSIAAPTDTSYVRRVNQTCTTEQTCKTPARSTSSCKHWQCSAPQG